MFTTFIKYLSQRKFSENDLSDIIYAACHSSQKFKEVFIKFFFNNIEDCSQIILEREYHKEEARVDFSFLYNGELYIIENKIYDRNQHLGIYDNIFEVSPKRFGYITNYDSFIFNNISKTEYKNKGYKIYSWNEFYNHLTSTRNTDDIFAPIATYIKSVCSIIKLNTPMNLSSLNELPKFLELLKEVFNLETDRYVSVYYDKNCTQQTYWGGNIANPHNNCIVGRYFEVKFKTLKRNSLTCGWMGIYFNEIDTKPTIKIGIREDKEWSGTAYSLLSKEATKNSEWYISKNVAWFELEEELFDKFNTLSNIEEQKALLSNFYSSAIDKIADLIDKKNAQ